MVEVTTATRLRSVEFDFAGAGAHDEHVQFLVGSDIDTPISVMPSMLPRLCTVWEGWKATALRDTGAGVLVYAPSPGRCFPARFA